MDSNRWDDVRRARDETKSLPFPPPAKERYARALLLYIAYLRSRRATDPEYDKLLNLIREPRRVQILTGHDDRERLLTTVEHYVGYLKARQLSESEIEAFQKLAEEIRDIDRQP